MSVEHQEIDPRDTTTETARPTAADLDPWTRLLYRGSVVGDLALRTGLATVVSSTVLPGTVLGRTGHDRDDLAFYAGYARARDASRVFRRPPRTVVSVEPGRDHGLSGERVELLTFDSGYETLNPDFRAAYDGHRANRTAHAQHWRHESGPRPTLVVVHGFGASPASFNTAFFSLRQFFADGWDILLYTLPFHGSRRERWLPLNGLGLFSHGMPHLCEAVIHAIHDLQILLDHLEERGAPRVGVTGLSLGGYISALLAEVDPRLDFAIPNAAVTWMPGLFDSWFPANLTVRLGRSVAGVTAAELADALAVHSPLTYAPVIPHERLMVIGGLGDRLAPPEQSLMLWEHWGRPALHWFPGNHVLHLGRNDYLDSMRRLMAVGRAD